MTHAVVWFLTMLMLGMTFLLSRVIIPALVNLHNDGALILVWLLVVAAPIIWGVFWMKVLRPYIEGNLN